MGLSHRSPGEALAEGYLQRQNHFYSQKTAGADIFGSSQREGLSTCGAPRGGKRGAERRLAARRLAPIAMWTCKLIGP